MGMKENLYILTGQEPTKIEGAKNLVLLAIQATQSALGARAAANMLLFSNLSRIVVRDLFNFFELLHHQRLTDVDSGLVQLPVKHRYKRQCQDTVERMHAKHLVCPVMRGGKADEIGIFHIPKSSLDVMLAAIAEYDLFVGKIFAISKQDPLAENAPFQFIVSFVVSPKFDVKPPSFTSDLCPKKISDILAGDDLIQILLKALRSVGFAPPSGFMAAGDTHPEIAQGLQLFGKMLPYAANLSLEQSPASGDYDRAFLSENFFLRAMDPNPFKKRISEVTEPFERNGQEILVLGRNERAYEMVRRPVKRSNVFLRIVPFIENECDALTFLFEHLVAGNQIIQNLAEGDGVVLVPFVGLGKKRDVKIPRDQQRQANNAKISTFGLRVSALGQRSRVVGGKKSIEVGGVVKEGAQIHIQPFHHAPRNIVFDPGKNRFVQVVHVVPESLTPQSGSADREKPTQDGTPVPDGKFAFARRRNRSIESCQQYILAHGRSLVPFRRVAVDRADDVQLLCRVPKCGGCSKIPLFGKERTARSFGQAVEQLLSGTEMAHNAHARPAALIPIGFDDAPVSFSSYHIVLQARHDSYIHDLVCAVNRNRNIW